MRLIKILARRIRFWWNLVGAYLTRYRYWIATIIFFFLIITLAITNLWPKISRSNTITLGYVGVYTLETIPTEILSLATQSLIAAGPDGRPQPSLASHWQVSEDGKTYIVFLKDNLKWHDATNLDAKDISIAIQNVKITALNNKTIEFKLPNPISSFPHALNKPVFKTKTFYGTGEFRIVDIDQVDNVVKKISLVPKEKKLPRVDIKFYQSEVQAASALKIGEIKSATVANADIFETWPNLDVEKTVDESEVVTIFYNNEDPQLSSEELRQALSFAINKIEFDGKIATGPISPSNWAYSTNVKRYDYNTGKARELIAKSEGRDFTINLSVTPGLEKVAENIKRDWEALGVKTNLKFEKTVPATFQAMLVVNKLQPDPDQYALWHSTQRESNITRFKDVRIDKLLEDARTTQDETKRKELYFDFQKSLVEDVPATFLYHPYKYRVTYKNIRTLISKLPK